MVYLNVKKVSYKEYIKKFEHLYYNVIDKKEQFKVDKPVHNNNNIYYINKYSCCCCNINNKNKIIELKGLISKKGYGSILLNFITSKYNKDYFIILDSFNSNNKFYQKNNFKIYKKVSYNPIYDPLHLNKNKEPVYYYFYYNGTLQYLKYKDILKGGNI